LEGIAKKDGWSVAGKEKVGAVETEILALVQKGLPLEQSTLKLYVDPIGRILKIRSVNMTDAGALAVVSIFDDPKYSHSDGVKFDCLIPDGYMPSMPPKTVQSVATGDEASLGKLVEWPSRNPVDFTKTKLKGPTVVLFSSNDTIDERESDWTGLAAECKKAGVGFLQVWIGAEPPRQNARWPVYWDKDGENELGFGIPSTPYVLGFKDGVVESGWQGLADDSGKEAAASILDPLTGGHYSPKTRSAKMRATKSSTGSGGD
jgi:hypothetical protein